MLLVLVMQGIFPYYLCLIAEIIISKTTPAKSTPIIKTM